MRIPVAYGTVLGFEFETQNGFALGDRTMQSQILLVANDRVNAEATIKLTRDW